MDGLDNKPGNFGIETTTEADFGSAGSQDLINDLLSPETSTASPDSVLSIADAEEKEKADKEAADLAAAAKDKDDEETKTGPDALSDFLLGNEKDMSDEDSDEDDDADDAEKGKGKDGDEGKGGDEDDGDEEGNIAFDTLANELFDLGVFNKGEGEEDLKIEDPEQFLERFKLEQQRGANEMVKNFIGQFGQEHQDAFQAVFVEGANPRDFFTAQAKIGDFKSMDLTKETNQESVVREALQNQGYEPEDIDSEVEKLKNYGDLEDVSKRHHKVLVKNEEKQLQAKALEAKTELQFKQKAKDEYVNNVRNVLTEKIKAKEFDGIPVNTQTANELQDFLLVDKWKTDSGETLTDFDKTILELKRPENHAAKVKVALLLKLLDKDPTLSTIQKSGVSKKSSALFKEVARQKTTAKRAVSDNPKPAPTWFKQK